MLFSCLYQDELGTQLRRADPIDFIETDHQRVFRRITGFINHQQDAKDVFYDLRVFLETEVRSRYHRTICENHLEKHQFALLLAEMKRLGILSNEIWGAVDRLRLTLNTGHHVWSDRSHEEKIGIAEDVLQCVYEFLK